MEGGADLADQANAFLDLLSSHLGLSARSSSAQEELALRLRHVKALLSLLGVEPYLVDWVRKNRSEFLGRIRAAADDSGNELLEACWACVMDQAGFDARLRRIEVTDRTVRLFELSREHHARAVEYHLARGAWQTSADIRSAWGERLLAAAIHEEHGDAAYACKIYREEKAWDRALQCALRDGDSVEVARAHEGLRDYRRALEIWTSLGRVRDAARVEKKMGKDPEAQLGLFDRT